jgi:hypothetical protein
MQLTELGLNRFCGKETSSDNGSLSMSLNAGSSVPNSDSYVPTGNVLSGTVITNCLEQSSPGPDRIETNSFLTVPQPGLPQQFLKTDCFVAYNSNIGVVLINKYGIFSDESILYNVAVDNTFTYYQVLQPINYFGGVTALGSLFLLNTTGWTVSHTGTGKYRITHSLNDSSYAVNATIIKTGANNPCIAITNPGVNSFDVECEEYSFDGGGLYLGLLPTDEAFYFSLQRLPPFTP